MQETASSSFNEGTIVVPNYVICPKYVRKLLAVDLSDPILNPGISKDTGRKIHPSPTYVQFHIQNVCSKIFRISPFFVRPSLHLAFFIQLSVIDSNPHVDSFHNY